MDTRKRLSDGKPALKGRHVIAPITNIREPDTYWGKQGVVTRILSIKENPLVDPPTPAKENDLFCTNEQWYLLSELRHATKEEIKDFKKSERYGNESKFF